jgi:protein SCO1/2
MTSVKVFQRLCLALGLLSAIPAFGTDTPTNVLPAALKDIGITEKLGENVAIHELQFTDEAGQKVQLSKYFQAKRPVVLALVYYACPNLCTLVLNGLVDSLKQMDWAAGNQFEVVAVSIDAREKPELAAQKKAAYLKDLNRPGQENGWHFLVGEQDSITKLASQVGFGYRYNPEDGQFAHGAALFVLTPEGKLSRILYGIQYRPQDMKLSLVEASNGGVGTILDRFVLFCYSYDPLTRKYSLVLSRVMQAGSAGTVVVFGAYMALFWRRQRLGLGRRNS